MFAAALLYLPAMKNTYLVTGGCGFIGSHICEALVAEGHSVRILDNLSSGNMQNVEHLKGKVEVIIEDICHPAEVEKAANGVDYIFHEAALVSVFDSVDRPELNHDVNLTGTFNVMQAARKHSVKRVVMASSAAIYGNDPALPKTELMRPQPESPYAIGKIVGEYYLRVYSQLFGVQAVSLRYFNVYGPRQNPKSFYSGVISKFTDDIKNGRTPTIFGDGQQTRDFVFVKDVVQANLLAMHSDEAGHGEAFNVGTGRNVSLLDLLGILGELTGKQISPVFKPARAGDIRHSVSDISAAKRDLGYAPAFSLKQGLGELLKWMKG